MNSDRHFNDLALIAASDPLILSAVRGWLPESVWTCASLEDMDADLLDRAAILIVDARSRDFADILRAVRLSPGFGAGVPVLRLADDGETAGANAALAAPLEQADFASAMAQWAGPLTDSRFRDRSSPYYRLMRIAGRSKADALFCRFAQTLRQAVDPDGPPPSAHQLAGLAGCMGYTDLGEAWADVENAGEDALFTALRLTRDVIDELVGSLLPQH